MLEYGGFTVILAGDGRQAIELFRHHADDVRLVLLDMTMPHLGGEETFRELRRIRDGVKVVMMSGYNEQEVINRFAGKGLGGFIQKPFRQKRLLSTIRDVLGEGRASDLPRTVLVIDDVAIVRESVKALLGSFGYEVLVAENGQRGIELFKECAAKVVVVLLDLNLPDMTADDVYQEIRHYSDVQVILLTGQMTHEIADQFLEMGFSATLEKPIPMETLLSFVERTLQSKS